MTARTNKAVFGNFRAIPASEIPKIRHNGRPGIVKTLPIFKDFERVVLEGRAPFEALCFNIDPTTDESLKKLKAPKTTLLSAFRKTLKARKMDQKYNVFLRGTVLYLVDTLALNKISEAA